MTGASCATRPRPETVGGTPVTTPFTISGPPSRSAAHGASRVRRGRGYAVGFLCVLLVAAALTVLSVLPVVPGNAGPGVGAGAAPAAAGAQVPAGRAPAGVPAPAATAAAGSRQVIALRALQSASVSAKRPRQATPRDRVLRLEGRRVQSYVKFDRGALAGRTILKASLKLRVVARAGGGDVRAHPTSGRWSAGSLNHRRQPRQRSTVLGSSRGLAAKGAWVTVPIRTLTRGFAKKALAMRLSLGKGAGAANFARYGKFAPRLILVVAGPEAATASGGAVYAHYFPPFPISFDNRPPARDYYARQYLTINGEGRKHSAYGGYLRDRPLGRSPGTGDWEVTDLRTEIRQAKEAGIDGFMVDILNLSGMNWDRTRDLMRAADREGDFTVMPNLDLTASDVVGSSPERIARALALLMSHPSATGLAGGYGVGSFYAEGRSPAWWGSVLETLRGEHGITGKFLAVFLGPSPQRLKSYRSVAHGFGSWGTRTAQGARDSRNFARMAHRLGRTWVQPVAVQDARPKSGLYAEAGNTETLRATWTRAIKDDADYVQVITWNDYSESTSIAPSMAHGTTYSEINEYYATWFKTGRAPRITTDRVHLTHRVHPWSARARSGIMNMQPDLGGSEVPPRDTVEALVFLTAPARVTLTSGLQARSLELPSGVHSLVVDLAAGRPRVTISRQGTVVKSLTSPHEVTTSPVVQDLQYWASSA